jgi:hypothetical protein
LIVWFIFFETLEIGVGRNILVCCCSIDHSWLLFFGICKLGLGIC